MAANTLRVLGIAICLALAFGGYGKAAPAPTMLSVTPTEGVATQTVGQAASPPSFTFRITTNRGSINWRVGSLPSWLKASAMSGKTAATLVLTVQPVQTAGTYTASIPIIASTNTVTLNARLTVTAAAPVPVPVPPSSGCPGRLLDKMGGALTTADGDRLVC